VNQTASESNPGRKTDESLVQTVPAWSIAVMCFNEAGNLRQMVERTVAVMLGQKDTFEIVIVDDGSSDGSGKIADELAVQFPQVRVLHHPTNTGIGSVLIDGYAQSKGVVVAILPADLQFAPEDLPAAMKAIADADVINITRNQRNDPSYRRLISFVDRSLVRVLFGLRVTDLHWVKLYRRTVLERITIVSRTPLVDTELLIKANRMNARIVELDLPHHPRTAGKSKGATVRLLIKTFIDLIALRWKL
jgi:glycosyltransferase involved in cell wall biosynthesis